MTKLHELQKLGQSSWLNYMRRAFIVSGGLRHSLAQGIRGVTANAQVFEETIRQEDEYDRAIQAQMMAGTPTTRIHESLMVDDVQRAADLLHPIFEESEGLDGVASLEVDPALAEDSVAMVATVRRLLAKVDRGNAMAEVPATLAGAEAVQALTADGVHLNATHIFSISAFERIAQAYICGLETYFQTHSVWRMAPTSVASVSIAPLDQAVDEHLRALGRQEYAGKTAVAMARVLYVRYRTVFSGPRWQALTARGARPLRPKWTRLTAGAEPETSLNYIEALIGPDTVVTFRPQTRDLFLAQGRVARTLDRDSDAAVDHLAQIRGLGIDLEAVAEELQHNYLLAADRQYQALIASVIQKLIAEVPGY